MPAPFSAPTPPALAALASYLPLLTVEARLHGLPPGLVEAVALAESGGDPLARSEDGAVGLLQVTPVAARQVGAPIATAPQQAVAGVLYLAWLRGLYGVPTRCLVASPAGRCRALAVRMVGAYYAGPGGATSALYVGRVYRRWSDIASEEGEAG